MGFRQSKANRMINTTRVNMALEIDRKYAEGAKRKEFLESIKIDRWRI